jgi:hypothetical protein
MIMATMASVALFLQDSWAPEGSSGPLGSSALTYCPDFITANRLFRRIHHYVVGENMNLPRSISGFPAGAKENKAKVILADVLVLP